MRCPYEYLYQGPLDRLIRSYKTETEGKYLRKQEEAAKAQISGRNNRTQEQSDYRTEQ